MTFSNKTVKDARDALFTEIYDIIEAGALKVVDGQVFKTGPVEALAEAGMGDLAKTVKKISETIGEGREQLSQASEKGKARLLSVAVEAIETLRASGNAEAFKEIAILQKAIYEEEILGDINKGMTPMISALNQLIKKVKNKLENKDKTVKGFNVGINSGKVAGQSIKHCHIHLIPRREGDVENPQGGVRGVIPSKQHYIRKNK